MAELEEQPNSPLSDGPIKHYEGFLEKKGPKEKDYEKQWVILEGRSMIVYPQRVAQRERSFVKPVDIVTIDKQTEVKPNDKVKTKLTVKFKSCSYKFKMATADERDNWWIRIYAMSKLKVPDVHLLPGQIIALQEIINSIPQSNVTSITCQMLNTSPDPDLRVRGEPPDWNTHYRFYPEKLISNFKDDFPVPPKWFFQVARGQAEELLLNNPEHGSILIRECESHPGDYMYSLSMRQEPPVGNPLVPSMIKHFRFSWNNDMGTFKMMIQEPQPIMPTMYDLLAFFIEKHGGCVRPMQTNDPSVLKMLQHPYELGLSNRVGQKDPENGEAKHKLTETNYLQPHQKVGPPAIPSSQRPSRQSQPSFFNDSLSPLSPPGAAASPPGAAASPPGAGVLRSSSTSRPPKRQGNRDRCQSTSAMEGVIHSPPQRKTAITTELNDVFKQQCGIRYK